MAEGINMSKLRETLASLIFGIFLKVIGMSTEQFWEKIYQQEKEHKTNNNLPL